MQQPRFGRAGYWSDLRRKNGRADPWDVKLWCLGNEMDGPWQIGARSAEEYGALAARTAAAMKRYDPALELVVCGSSGSGMPTFGSWERTVLTHAYPHVDHISCHAYYQQHDGDLASFLASPVDMDRMIDTVTGIADEVGAALGESRRIQVSFDEWNVWYQDGAASEPPTDWPVAPRLLEDDYDVADAVVVGGLLISLLRHADRVTAACQAQLVNVIAPIRTEPGGAAWRQTIFHPFALASRLARGRVLSSTVEAPSLATSKYGDVPAVDAVVVWDDDAGGGAALLVNRSPTAEADVLIDVAELAGFSVAEAYMLHDADPSARNSAAAPDRVVPQPCAVRPADGGGLRVTMPPVSWAAVGLRR